MKSLHPQRHKLESSCVGRDEDGRKRGEKQQRRKRRGGTGEDGEEGEEEKQEEEEVGEKRSWREGARNQGS